MAEKLLEISYMWFGDKNDPYLLKRHEDMSVYDLLEERILTRGMVGIEKDDQALKLQTLIEKELEKERREEGLYVRKEKIGKFLDTQRKRMRWAFPDYHYMSSIYPAVEKIPILLPLYWVVRGMRLLWRSVIR